MKMTVSMLQKLKKICDVNSYTIYQYKPTVWKPLLIHMEAIYFRRRIRLFLECFAGNCVYYLVQNDCFIGYCVVSRGGTFRYQFSTKKDIIVGPYYISESHRGKRLSELLLTQVLAFWKENYEYAYDYIEKSNIASIKASQAVGLEIIQEVNITPFIRKLVIDNEGEYYLLRMNNTD
ncbi:MAG: GNAT family N-acetyltransferase [Oscillospiraceae bacterium]|nr:GNAT family N-acetyltransferase [Oscillospiraceae bacterium]